MVPKISIIVAAYNVEKYIQRCLNSLRNQTLQEIEVIVINDGSTDNTQYLCETFQTLDDRFQVITQENRGLSEARNTGIKKATAQYIAFVDGDDFVNETIYEKLYQEIYLKNADLVICDFFKVWEDHSLEILKSKRYYFNSGLLKGNIMVNFLTKHDESFVVAWNKLYKLEVIKENNISFVNKAFFEDVGFMYKYLCKVNEICYLKEPLYYYSQRSGSITKTYNPIIVDSLKNTINIVNNNNRNINKEYISTFKLRLLIFTLNYFLQNSINKDSIKEQIIDLKSYSKNLPFKHRIVFFLLKMRIYDSVYLKVYRYLI